MATGAQAARHIDLSERRFRELLDLGVIARRSSGKYDLASVRVSYVRALRKQAAGRMDKNSTLADERAGWTKARRLAAERENALAAGRLVDIELIEKFLERTFGVVRENFLVLPGVHGYEIATAARAAPSDEAGAIIVAEKLRLAIYAALEALADNENPAWKAVRSEMTRETRPSPPAAEGAAK